MLRRPTRTLQKTKATIGIVASRYNGRYVDGMLRHARAALKQAGARVEILRVPGAFEIPLIASRWASGGKVSAIICLGVIIRGETAHADHVGRSVSQLLGQIAVETGLPIVHEVLLLNDAAQAKVRCLESTCNRGTEAAATALEMVAICRDQRLGSPSQRDKRAL